MPGACGGSPWLSLTRAIVMTKVAWSGFIAMPSRGRRECPGAQSNGDVLVDLRIHSRLRFQCQTLLDDAVGISCQYCLAESTATPMLTFQTFHSCFMNSSNGFTALFHASLSFRTSHPPVARHRQQFNHSSPSVFQQSDQLIEPGSWVASDSFMGPSPQRDWPELAPARRLGPGPFTRNRMRVPNTFCPRAPNSLSATRRNR